MYQPPAEEQLIGIADAELRVVNADPRMRRLLGASAPEGRSLLDLLPPPAHPLVNLAACRVTGRVVLPSSVDDVVIVVRPAAVGDETWLLLFEQPKRRSRPPRSAEPLLVGRHNELREFDRYLAEPNGTILYLQGPLGIGKTALLTALAARCDELQCPRFWIDARSLPPTQDAIARILTGGADRSPLQRVEAALDLGAQRWVVLIDNFDAWQDLETTEHPCAHLPAACRVVVASRHGPNPRYWGPSVRPPRTTDVGALDEAAAAQLVASLGVPAERAGELLAQAAGHPLCIVTLASALRAGKSFAEAALPLDPDLAAAAPREVLEVAALPARITEDVLAALLDDVDAAAAFDVLATLAVRDPHGIGLRMPVVVREALARRIRERNPARYAELEQRLALYVTAQLELGTASHLVPILDDFFDSLDDRLAIKRAVGARLDGLPASRRAREGDRAPIEEAARLLGGDVLAASVLGRLDCDAAVTCVAEGPSGIEGICQYVTLSSTTPKLPEARDDAELGAALDLLRRRTTLAADEYALVVLLWAASDVARGRWEGPSQSLLRYMFPMLVSRPQAAVAIAVLPRDPLPLPAPDVWSAEPAVTVGPHTLLYRDLRGLTARRILTGLLGSSEARAPVMFPVPLHLEAQISSETVREALTLLERPERLVGSQLLTLRSVEVGAGANATTTDKVVALERLLRQTITSLGSGRRESKQREALEAVFFERAGKHEKIAADLGMPYSTFRRCLSRGLEGVAELLRMREQALRRAPSEQ
ncbi:MAG: hypothetical protein KF782_16500 [Labilithrix sp.]|nr:hypothetical protein [Labilithrix sp.]